LWAKVGWKDGPMNKVVVELKADMARMKHSLPDIKEIKELLSEIKKNEKLLEGGENSVNDEEKKEEGSVHGNNSDEE